MRNVEDVYRLTPMQHGLLFHTLYAREAGMYLEQLCYHLRGRLDPAALERAWNAMVARHPIFRTALVWQGLDEPLQVVRETAPLPWKVHDWRGRDEADQQAALEGWLVEDRARGFALEEAPLMRGALHRLGDDAWVFVWTFHHALLDGWSCPIVLDEAFTLYDAACRGAEAALPPVRPYRDYIAWLGEQDGDDAEAYWRRTLAGFTAPVSLPIEAGAGSEAGEAFGEVRLTLSPEVTAALGAMVRRHRLTASTVVQGAWALLLARYTGRDDVVFGTTVSGRHADLPGIESMVGLFVNTVPTRVAVDSGAPLVPWLAALRQAQVEAEPHVASSLVDIQGWSEVPRGTPLFGSLVGFENYPRDLASLALPGGLAVTGFRAVERVHYPLTLLAVPGTELTLLFYFDRHRFTRVAVERLGGHLRTLIAAMIEGPERRLFELPLLDRGERQRILETWNATATAYPRTATLAELFRCQAAATPDAVALVVAGGETLTYGTLHARARDLARVLRARGVGPDVVVGLLLDRSADLVIALLAVVQAGGAYLPLDARAPQERLALTLDDARVSLVLTVRARRGRLGNVPATILCVDDPADAASQQPAVHPADAASQHDACRAGAPCEPDHLAYVMYTSGSTGRPKGVAVPHRAVVRLVTETDVAPFGPDEVVLHFAPPSFDAATLEVWGALLNGARLAIFPEATPSLDELGRFVATEDVTTLWLTAGLFHRVAEDQVGRLATVRRLLAGGDVVAPAAVRRVLARWPALTVVNGYGPTENTTFTCCHPMTAATEPGDTVPIGRPIANTRVYVLDGALAPVPPGVPGELHAAGDGLARGYLHRPALTAEVFGPDPHGPPPGARMYRTGDRARFREDGVVEFLGRVDRQAKVRGFRLEPAEIEAHLAAHPAVREAAVDVRADAAGERQVIAYVVPDPAAPAPGDDGAGAARHVAGWQDIFDEHIYAADAPVDDPLFNTTGWISRLDGRPIPRSEMRAWADDIVSAVRARAPRRVLEIGCGTGMLLFQLAPEVEAYLGTDFSQVALDYVEAQRRRHRPDLAHLRLERRLADDFTGIADGAWDAVVLSSVVQYFPDADYLLRVLEGSARVVRPGGAIHVCDVRHLGLLPLLHTAAALGGAPDDGATAALKQAAQRGLREENELAVDPAFFVRLARRWPTIGAVQVRLQRGAGVNELNQFRYHVVLTVGDAAPPPGPPRVDGRGLGLAGVRAHLERAGSAGLAVIGLVNRRVAREAAAVELLASPGCPPTAAALRAAVDQAAVAGVDPDALWAVGAELGWETVVSWSAGHPDAVDVLFVPPGTGTAVVTPLPSGATAGSLADAGEDDEWPWHAYTSHPAQAAARAPLGPVLRRYLEARLPDYMIPSAFVTLDHLPLTRTGKVDREALPSPEGPLPDRGEGAVARSPLEEALAEAFAAVLGLPRVTIEDSFFALGGHSLSATSLVSRLRDVLGVELPLRAVFEQPTVRGLAAWIETRDGHAVSLPPVEPVDGARPQPLSFAQRRLWFLERMGTTGSAYHSPLNLRLRGPLHREALARSLEELARRHEALRTGFHEVDGEPVQVVAPAGALPLPQDDLRDLPRPAREAAARRLVEEENARPFDLARGPLLRARLVRLADAEHLLLLTFHHVAFDGWSVGVLVRELGALYQAFARGRRPALPPLPVQYPAFAAWQQSRAFAEAVEAQVAYWRGQLADLPPLALPTDHPRPPVQSVAGAIHDVEIPADVREALERLARDEGATLYMTLLTAFTALLHRYTGQERVAVGAPIANRNRGETEGLIGFFVNTLVLAATVEPARPFRELLARVKETALQAYAHQDAPFERLVEDLAPERDVSKNPLVQVSFALQQPEHMAPRFDLEGLEVSLLERSGITVRVDLELDVWPEGRVLRAMWVYSTALFAPATIERMAGHFLTLLRAVAAAPDTPVAHLAILSPAERRALVGDPDTEAPEEPRSAGVTGVAARPLQAGAIDAETRPAPARVADGPGVGLRVHEVFERWAAAMPDAAAAVFEDAVVTHGELNARANRLAHHLRALGVGPEVLVAIGLPRGIDLVTAVLATLKAGGAFLPLDPAYPSERLAAMMTEAAAAVLVASVDVLDRLPTGDAVLVNLDDDAEAIAACPATDPPRDGTDANLAYVIYTSGSTGRPKGVAIDHRGLSKLQAAQGAVVHLSPEDRVLQFASPSFDAAVSEMVMAWARGAALVLARRETLRAVPDLRACLTEQAVTVVTLPPSVLGVMAPMGPALGVVLSAGEACSAAVVDAWAPGRRFFNAYGPSETTVCALMSLARAGESEPPPVGVPIPRTRVYVLDAALEPVPAGVVGEIHIGGEGVARGYLRRPDQTAERFGPDPFAGGGARMYRTGDLARRRPDGAIDFLGRVDRQVKIRGHRIEPGEIESVLEAHPEVADAAVVVEERALVPASSGVEVWPSVAEYFVYDETLYHAMTHDEKRNAHYRAAIARHVPGRTVVDIGTGADAILARMCVEAGARHVWAVEVLEDAYRRACQRVRDLGLGDRITVLHGDAAAVTLPEPVDVCVSELVGSIGGAEGAAAIIEDARRLLRPGGRMIPARSITHLAAVTLPDGVMERPALTPLTAAYAERIFAQVGRRFDVRVCLKGVGRRHLVSGPAVLEDLDFQAPLTLESSHRVELVVDRDTRLDGFLAWLELSTVEDRRLDILDDTYCWLPVFLPAFGAGLPVVRGTRIEATITRRLAPNGRNPDYAIEGRVVAPGGLARPFVHVSRHAATEYAASSFYRRLFTPRATAPGGDARLVAHVVPRPDPGAARGALVAQQLADWRGIFDGTIASAPAPGDPALDTAGWVDSYEGRPFPASTMARWADDAAAQVLAARPRRVLEVGCGTGMLLFRIAPHCEAYHGLDVSETSLARLQGHLAAAGGALGHVCLECRRADDLDALPAGEYDAVVLNSVVQYFPDLDYVLEVLDGCLRRLRPGGVVFLGDLRNLDLAESFYTSVELAGAGDDVTVEALRERIRRRRLHEDELFLSPALFPALPARWPALREVRLRLPDSTEASELSTFRFQALLRVGGETPRAPAANPGPVVGSETLMGPTCVVDLETVASPGSAVRPETVACSEAVVGPDTVARPEAVVEPEPVVGSQRRADPESGARMSLEDIGERLAAERPSRWWVTGLAHHPVGRDVEAVRRLATAEPTARAAALRDRLRDDPAAIDPQALRALAASHGYAAEVFWTAGGGDGRMDALFVRGDVAETEPPALPLGEARPRPWETYANRPLLARRIAPLAAALRELAAAKLPAYLRPAAFVVLDRMPLTPEGKIDRRALPPADASQEGVADDGAPSVSPVEETLAGLFAELLGRERVGPHERFFELGGHSLLATTLVSRLRDTLDVELPLQKVFELETPAALARWIAERPRGDEPAPRLEPVGREAPLPLSFAQQRLWFLAQMGLVGHGYNVPLHMRMLGPLDLSALRRALGEIVRRHESLRTCFRTVGDEPVQVILPPAEVPLPLVDLADRAPAAQDAALAELVRTENRALFDLSRGPVLRASLVRRGPADHVLLLSVHHIASDGWSLGVVVRELSALYAAFAEGAPSPLADLRVQYADFAAWQRRWLAGPVLERQLRHWTARLREAAPLRLPTDRPRPAVERFHGAFTGLAVGEETGAALRALGRRHGATLFMTLLAAFQALLGRYSGQEQVVVGSPIANRTRGETEDLIGFFVNSLVLTGDLAGRPTFEELLARVRRATLEAYAHQDLPFERLVEELAPERHLSRNPLFQVMFALQPRESVVPGFRLPGLAVSLLPPEEVTVRFDLEVYVWPEGQGLRGAWIYNAELFDATTAERMARHFEALLEVVARDPARPVAHLPLLAPEEVHQALQAWNDTRTTYPRTTIPALFEAQATRRPDATALVFDAGGDDVPEFLTYGALNARGNRLAHRLRRLGVGPGDLVALALERSPALITGLLAILKTGAAYLPIDPSHPEAHQRTVMRDARPRVRLVPGRSPAEGAGANGGAPEVLAVALDDPTLAGESVADPPPAGWPESPAYVTYTSGSTGVPKGIVIPHRAVTRLLFATNYVSLGPDDRLAHTSNVAFDAATFEIWGALLHGGRLVVLPRDTALSPTAYAAALRDHHVSALFLTPVLFNRLIEELPDAFTPVGTVLVGGEAPSPEHVRRVLARPPGRLLNGYGPTESTTFAAWHEIRDVPEEATSVPIGRPLANTRLYVLDEALAPVPAGAPGELTIGGDGLAHGYLGQPGLTAERFVPDPHAGVAGARLYRTGDLARQGPDGVVDFLGRLDDQVKVRGFRIEPGEIEAHLAAHPAVRAAAVTLSRTADGDARLAAHVVLAEDALAESDALAAAQVADWERVFDEHVYDGGTPPEDPYFNTVGWRSSYDGRPIPVAEMRVWAADVVGHVLRRRPRRVLELGCGTGMLLFAIAPRCERYVGLDVSGVSLQAIERQRQAEPSRWGHVELRHGAAHDLEGFAPGSFDVVLLSSTVQYFPGEDYLLSVLAGSARLLAPGGAIILADVRSLPLLEAFHASVELTRAAPDCPTEELRRRIRHAVWAERELTVDPGFFAALPRRLPAISQIRIELQRGGAANELSRFRYAAILDTTAPGPAPATPEWRDGADLDLARLRRQMEDERPPVLAYTGVPNARVLAAVETAALAAADDAPATVHGVRRAVQPSDRGLEPDDLRALGEELGYETRVSWTAGSPAGIDVLFVRANPPAGAPRPPLIVSTTADLLPTSPDPSTTADAHDTPAAAAVGPPPGGWTNHPLRARVAPEMVRALRRHLGERLPDFMVPADFVVLESLPVGPTGKVDRRALPAPVRAAPAPAGAFEEGRTPGEQTLARLFADLLGVARVGRDDSFFDLGGHSLLATRLASRIREALRVELPLREIFETPTVAGVARAVARARLAAARPEDLADLLDELELLPEDEVQRRLGADAERR